MRGQISVETLIVVALLIGFFVISLMVSANINIHADVLDAKYSEANYCNKIAFLLNSLYNAGPFTKATIFLENDVNIGGQEIVVGRNSCFFTGNANSVNLHIGQAEFKNLDGNVVARNV